MENQCCCENSHCDHGDKLCNRTHNTTVKTIWGTFLMCSSCAEKMPDKYLKKEEVVMGYQIAWYDGWGGKPDYSNKIFDSPEEASSAAAEEACERGGGDVPYGVVTAKTHRRVKL